MHSISASEMEHPRARYSITASEHDRSRGGPASTDAALLSSPPHGSVVSWLSGMGTPMQTLPLVMVSMYDGASSGVKVLCWNAGPAYDTVAARVSWRTSNVGTAGEQMG